MREAELNYTVKQMHSLAGVGLQDCQEEHGFVVQDAWGGSGDGASCRHVDLD